MQDFNYHGPSTLAEAVAAIKDAEEGKYMSGGQSLLPVMKLDLAQPSDVISLNGISELKGIQVDRGVLVLGAASTHAEVSNASMVRETIGALADMAGLIGDPQVRNRGTLGGSIAHADPAADYPAALVALNATVKTDRREIAAEAFFTGLFETALEDDEIVVSVSFPIPKRAAYAKFPNPASKFAVVGVMVAETDDGVRVAVAGAGPTVFRVAAMERALANDFSANALEGIAVAQDELNSDPDASAEYRAHLVAVMAKRAVAAAAG